MNGGSGRSIQTDLPPSRWRDQSASGGSDGDQAVKRAIEERFGFHRTRPSHSLSSRPAPPPQSFNDNKVKGISGGGGEVLEPHSLPPGTAPDAQLSSMQEFCGQVSGSWIITGSHLSQCFIHTFLFSFVNAGFIVAASLRLREMLSLPPPPPRAITRKQLLKVTGSSLVAMYNLIMFAVHLAYDYGSPYQWIMYPASCLTWSLCVVVLLLEARYAWPTNWVCKGFWISSFLIATVLLWSNMMDGKFMGSHELIPFLMHYLLYAAMAAMALLLRESRDYASLAFDISDISVDEEDTALDANEDAKQSSRPMTRNMAPGSSESRRVLRRVLDLLADDKWLAMAALACCFIGAPIEIVQFVYAGMVVDDCAVPEGPSALAQYLAVLVALYLIEGVAAASQLILTSLVSERMAQRMRRAALTAALNQEVLYVESGKIDDITNCIQKHVHKVQDAGTIQVCQVLHSFIQSFVGFVFLLVLSWKLTLVGIAILPVVALLMLVQSTVIQSYSRRVVDAQELVGNYAVEVISNIRTVRSFAKEGFEKTKFSSQVMHSYQMAKKLGLAHGIVEGSGTLVLKLCFVLGVFYGGSLVHHNELSGGILVSYSFISLQVVMALSVLPPVIADISNAINSAQTVLELIDREPAVNSKGGLTLPQCEGKIELKDVTFAYSSHPDVPVLERVNFVADAKSHVAILGNKRSGKSTLIALIERFFDAQEGLVLLDDTDISTFDPVWLHHQIAFLPQDPVMFSASVKDNICFGQHLTQEKIEDAAKVAKLHQPILRLPDAYDTLVESSEEKGERRRRDVQLSQMMQHKIAIARAVAKDCSIWLIDDFGSSLPESSRAELYEILQEIIPGKTVISTSSSPLLWGQAANKVGVLVHGRIEEWGEPNELRMRQGLYSSLMRGEELGGQGGSSSARNEGASRARQLIDTFELNLTLSQPPEGPALDSLRRVIEEFRATT